MESDALATLRSPAEPRGPYADLAAWLASLRGDDAASPASRAFRAGLRADRLGYAFAAGYREALARMLGERRALALAATEAGGAHPRAIQTTLDDAGVLTGDKTFVTLAPLADEMLVVASRGAGDDGKNRLVVARVATSAPGVTVTPRKETPFAPEIPHAIVRFDRVTVSAVLPGDGYTAWLKPFRTIEDLHVLAATLGYLGGAARAYGWHDALAEIAALAVTAEDLAARDASAPEVHVALHGLFTAARRLAATLPWDAADADERARWQRDAPLLLVAEMARTQRFETARRALGL